MPSIHATSLTELISTPDCPSSRGASLMTNEVTVHQHHVMITGPIGVIGRVELGRSWDEGASGMGAGSLGTEQH